MEFLAAIGVLCSVGLALSLLLYAADKWLGDYGTPTINVNDEEPFTVEGGGTLLDALYGKRIFIPSACGGKGTCGFCKVAVAEGGGPLLPTEEPFLTPEEIKADVRLACQLKVKNDLVVKVKPEFLKVQEYRARVTSSTRLTPDTKEIRMELVEPKEIEFKPGQYVQVIVPGSDEFRAYSVSSPPEEKSVVELIVRIIPGGLGSTYLHWVEPGDEVRFTGPYGDFELSEDEATELVFVGGGCGMAPIKSIINYVYKKWPHRKGTLFFGARSAEDVYYLDEYEKLRKEHPEFAVHYALSEPKPDDAWDGDTGFIHTSVETRLSEGKKKQAFLCGPPPMVEATMRVLKSKGMGEDEIFYDKF